MKDLSLDQSMGCLENMKLFSDAFFERCRSCVMNRRFRQKVCTLTGAEMEPFKERAFSENEVP